MLSIEFKQLVAPGWRRGADNVMMNYGEVVMHHFAYRIHRHRCVIPAKAGIHVDFDRPNGFPPSRE